MLYRMKLCKHTYTYFRANKANVLYVLNTPEIASASTLFLHLFLYFLLFFKHGEPPPPQGLCTCSALALEHIFYSKRWGHLALGPTYVLWREAGVECIEQEDGLEWGKVRGWKTCRRVCTSPRETGV